MSSKPERPRCPVCRRFMANDTWRIPLLSYTGEDLMFVCRKCCYNRNGIVIRYFIKNKLSSNDKWHELSNIPIKRWREKSCQ